MEDTTGARLKRARERRNLSLAQVSETTRVRPQYLQALENDDLSVVPSTAQARGFLRIYAEFLGIKLEDLVPAVATKPVSTDATTSGAAGSREPKSESQITGPKLLESVRLRLAAWGVKAMVAEDAESSPASPGAKPSNHSARSVPPPATATSDLTEGKKKARR